MSPLKTIHEVENSRKLLSSISNLEGIISEIAKRLNATPEEIIMTYEELIEQLGENPRLDPPIRTGSGKTYDNSHRYATENLFKCTLADAHRAKKSEGYFNLKDLESIEYIQETPEIGSVTRRIIIPRPRDSCILLPLVEEWYNHKNKARTYRKQGFVVLQAEETYHEPTGEEGTGIDCLGGAGSGPVYGEIVKTHFWAFGRGEKLRNKPNPLSLGLKKLVRYLNSS